MNDKQGWCCIDPRRRGRAFLALLGITLALMISLQVIGGPLQSEAAPAGIISFELAGNLAGANDMIDSWGVQGQVYAGLSLGLDYLFMVAYSITIALGCVIVAGNLSTRFKFLKCVGILLAWVQLLAALLDALENYALIRVLLGSGNALWPQVALWSAVPKFLFVILGILFVILGALITIVPRNRSAPDSA